MSDEERHERHGCDVCGRTQTVRMGDRGPIKGELDRRRIGNFRFCTECLASATQTVEDVGGSPWLIVTMTSGRHRSERWLTGATDAT